MVEPELSYQRQPPGFDSVAVQAEPHKVHTACKRPAGFVAASPGRAVLATTRARMQNGCHTPARDVVDGKVNPGRCRERYRNIRHRPEGIRPDSQDTGYRRCIYQI